MLLEACRYAANELNKESLHIFAKDEDWINALKKIGFKESPESSLEIDIAATSGNITGKFSLYGLM